MNITIKSKFDTGNWSEVNGLPAQDDIIHYMEHLFASDPNKCYTRQELMSEVIKEFGIPATNAEADGPQSNTSAFYTRVTYLITDGLQGKRRADGHPFIKRLSSSVYQHISGNGVITGKARKQPKVSKRLVGQALVSVKILWELNNSPEEVICKLAHLWNDDVIEAAIKQIFI